MVKVEELFRTKDFEREMPPRKPKSQQGVQSIEVGGRLLRALADSPGPMMLRDLAAAAKIPAPQAHRYLVSFTRMGLIERVAESSLYDLGAFGLRLALAALGRMDAVTLATPVLTALRQETGHTVALAAWTNQGATMVRWLGADAPVVASLRLGSVMPLTRSATGAVFLTFLPRSTTALVVKKEFQDNARHGIEPTSEAELEAIIQRTRKIGAARTTDFIPGVAGISAPVFDRSGRLALALTVLGYSKPFEAKMDPFTETVRRAAARVSEHLGFSGLAEDSA